MKLIKKINLFYLCLIFYLFHVNSNDFKSKYKEFFEKIYPVINENYRLMEKEMLGCICDHEKIEEVREKNESIIYNIKERLQENIRLDENSKEKIISHLWHLNYSKYNKSLEDYRESIIFSKSSYYFFCLSQEFSEKIFEYFK